MLVRVPHRSQQADAGVYMFRCNIAQCKLWRHQAFTISFHFVLAVRVVALDLQPFFFKRFSARASLCLVQCIAIQRYHDASYDHDRDDSQLISCPGHGTCIHTGPGFCSPWAPPLFILQAPAMVPHVVQYPVHVSIYGIWYIPTILIVTKSWRYWGVHV